MKTLRMRTLRKRRGDLSFVVRSSPAQVGQPGTRTHSCARAVPRLGAAPAQSSEEVLPVPPHPHDESSSATPNLVPLGSTPRTDPVASFLYRVSFFRGHSTVPPRMRLCPGPSPQLIREQVPRNLGLCFRLRLVPRPVRGECFQSLRPTSVTTLRPCVWGTATAHPNLETRCTQGGESLDLRPLGRGPSGMSVNGASTTGLSPPVTGGRSREGVWLAEDTSDEHGISLPCRPLRDPSGPPSHSLRPESSLSLPGSPSRSRESGPYLGTDSPFRGFSTWSGRTSPFLAVVSSRRPSTPLPGTVKRRETSSTYPLLPLFPQPPPRTR